MIDFSLTAPVQLGGSEELKKEYFGELVEEAKLASFCLTQAAVAA